MKADRWGRLVRDGVADPSRKFGVIDGAMLKSIRDEALILGEQDIADGFSVIYGIGGRGINIGSITAERCNLDEGQVFCELKASLEMKAMKGGEVHPIVEYDTVEILQRRVEGAESAKCPLFPKWNQVKANKIIADVASRRYNHGKFDPKLRYSTHCIRHGVADEVLNKVYEARRKRCGWKLRGDGQSHTIANHYGVQGRELIARIREDRRQEIRYEEDNLATKRTAFETSGNRELEEKVDFLVVQESNTVVGRN